MVGSRPSFCVDLREQLVRVGLQPHTRSSIKVQVAQTSPRNFSALGVSDGAHTLQQKLLG